MSKLTAVEFLVVNLHYLHSTKWDDILIKAKEMEKEQIIDSFNNGAIDGSWGDRYQNGEQYYNETFNK